MAALERARDQDLAIHPRQDIEYVVVDDETSSRDRVALAHEEVETYDPSYYETQLVRAIESVLSPLGWDRTDIRRELAETEEDNVLPGREPLPRIVSRKPFDSTASQHHSPFNESKKP